MCTACVAPWLLFWCKFKVKRPKGKMFLPSKQMKVKFLLNSLEVNMQVALVSCCTQSALSCAAFCLKILKVEVEVVAHELFSPIMDYGPTQLGHLKMIST